MGYAGENDHNIKPLMAHTEDIKSLFELPFGKLEIELAANSMKPRLRWKLKAQYLEATAKF